MNAYSLTEIHIPVGVDGNLAALADIELGDQLGQRLLADQAVPEVHILLTRFGRYDPRGDRLRYGNFGRSGYLYGLTLRDRWFCHLSMGQQVAQRCSLDKLEMQVAGFLEAEGGVPVHAGVFGADPGRATLPNHGFGVFLTPLPFGLGVSQTQQLGDAGFHMLQQQSVIGIGSVCWFAIVALLRCLCSGKPASQDRWFALFLAVSVVCVPHPANHPNDRPKTQVGNQQQLRDPAAEQRQDQQNAAGQGREGGELFRIHVVVILSFLLDKRKRPRSRERKNCLSA